MTRYFIPTSSRPIIIDEPDPPALADPDLTRSTTNDTTASPAKED